MGRTESTEDDVDIEEGRGVEWIQEEIAGEEEGGLELVGA